MTNEIKEIYANKGQTLTPEIAQYTYNELRNAFNDEFQLAETIDYKNKNWQYTQTVKNNLATFASFKSHQSSQAIASLLTNNKGNARSFKEFSKLALEISKDYNVDYLKAEYNRAMQSGVMAKKWQDFEASKHLYPNLKYVTQRDDRVRASHAELDGLVYPVDDPFWDKYYPPNDWNCRCTVMATDELVNEIYDEDELPGIPKDFNNNVGKTAEPFPDSTYYETVQKDDVQRFINANDPAYEMVQITGAQKPIIVSKAHGKNEKNKNINALTPLAKRGDLVILQPVSKVPNVSSFDSLVNNIPTEIKTLSAATRATASTIDGEVRKAIKQIKQNNVNGNIVIHHLGNHNDNELVKLAMYRIKRSGENRIKKLTIINGENITKEIVIK